MMRFSNIFLYNTDSSIWLALVSFASSELPGGHDVISILIITRGDHYQDVRILLVQREYHQTVPADHLSI